MSKRENIQNQISAIDGKIARLQHRRGELMERLTRMAAKSAKVQAEPMTRPSTESSRSVEDAGQGVATGNPSERVADILSMMQQRFGDDRWDVEHSPASILCMLSQAERDELDRFVTMHNQNV